MLNEIIRKITEEYSVLSKETIDDWKENSKILELKKGTQLVKEEKFTNKLYFIYKGSAKAYHLKDGKLVTDWFAFDNQFICAITGYFLKAPSEHCIELTEDSIILEFEREKLTELSNQYHDFERLSRKVITRIMLQLQQRVVYLQFATAIERYEFLLKQFPEIESHISLGDIASYIGITQETLSRVRTKKYGDLI
ncbi:Crp/Fnr family transcriptional regulator [Cyclobacterium qasimii]|uniref:cAMP-binding protein n=2 Tax=Cyclobacterium qasimii TaxID=1350429 RepID=S7WPG7_9BACT|nr:Crp/Fnr family transcriptional regulator [Cyclobacterium qasimii]EPR68629.1 cAMP-binding protein [Cyclobacterium qasimii M12-11B]GEO23509.1 cyclic nucleotide-binding protein [Cyclobacterium qasimii]